MCPHFEPEHREWPQREVHHQIRMTFPYRGIRDVRTALFQLCGLSESEATIYIGAIKSVPDFFYLQLGDENSDLIGSYVLERENMLLRCKFNREIETSEVNRVVALTNMSAMLDSLFDQ